jgi:hypothetical protein
MYQQNWLSPDPAETVFEAWVKMVIITCVVVRIGFKNVVTPGEAKISSSRWLQSLKRRTQSQGMPRMR